MQDNLVLQPASAPFFVYPLNSQTVNGRGKSAKIFGVKFIACPPTKRSPASVYQTNVLNMKLSPELLRSVALGIGLGVSTVSCSVLGIDNKPVEHDEKCTKEACVQDCDKAKQTFNAWDNCPGCGMG